MMYEDRIVKWIFKERITPITRRFIRGNHLDVYAAALGIAVGSPWIFL